MFDDENNDNIDNDWKIYDKQKAIEETVN
jgi:hypothetical protein